MPIATASMTGRLTRVKSAKHDIFNTLEYRAFTFERRCKNADCLNIAEHPQLRNM